MQQKGRTEQILDRLESMIVNAQGALPPGKISIPKDEALLLVQELTMTMQQELKQYREITDKRAKIIREAQKEADDIIYEAEQSASRIRVSGRKTGVAPVRMLDLKEEERRALDSANEIYAASLIYTDEMMAEMEGVIADAYEKISSSYERTIRDLKQKSEIIAANRRELMEDLRSLEKEDRYQQILEIGQLLSEELYIARKHVQSEEEYNKVQLQFNLSSEDAQNDQEEDSAQMNLPLDEMTAKPEQDEAAVSEEEISEVSDTSEEMDTETEEALQEVTSEQEETEEIDEIEEPVEEEKPEEPTFSESVIGAMQRAAKIAVHGIDEEEEARLEEERAARHRAYLETHEDPVVAMALDERREMRYRHEDVDEEILSASVRFSPTTELPVKETRKATDIPIIRFED